MEISVIIPTYKPKDYLWECLDSVANQTLGKDKFEVILVLNGCNEPYMSNIEEYVSKYLSHINFHLIQTDIAGVSNARNVGIDQVQGEYITFIDDDDYVSPNFLESLLQKAAPNTVVLSNSISFVDGTEEFNENYYCRRSYYKIKKKKSIDLFHARAIFNGPWMKLLHRNHIEGFQFDTKLKNGEDSLFMFQISMNIKKLVIAEESAVYYRRLRADSATLSHRSLKNKLTNVLYLLKGYARAYFKSPLNYNLFFFASRFFATIKIFIH